MIECCFVANVLRGNETILHILLLACIASSISGLFFVRRYWRNGGNGGYFCFIPEVYSDLEITHLV